MMNTIPIMMLIIPLMADKYNSGKISCKSDDVLSQGFLTNLISAHHAGAERRELRDHSAAPDPFARPNQ